MKLFTLTFLAIIFGFSAQAQMVDCNVFMQGHYVELAIAPNGSHGSTIDAPTGYHPNVTQVMDDPCEGSYVYGYKLGFVSDPDMDGWATAPPGGAYYYGDYFMVGEPQEGWAIEIDGQEMNAFVPNYWMEGWSGYSSGPGTGGGDLPFNFTGGNVSYEDSAGILKSVWQGAYHV